ncbi:MAG: 2Fe-2S iron-sulfur cluster binding domain-containing protein, partial [Pseudomonadota bacterium]
MVQITVTYSDGEQAKFDIQPKETVLDAAEKEEIPLAYNCKGGICRACQAIDKTTGKTVLLCQIDNVTEDLQYDVSYTKIAVSTVPTIRRAKLLEFDHVCPSVYKLKYKLQFPISFLPGQYARVLVPSEVKGQDKVWRYFSMANAPSDPSTVYFYIKDIPEGEMSRYLTSRAKIGDITKITAPYGAFYLRDNNAPKLFIAGGTGLAPML